MLRKIKCLAGLIMVISGTVSAGGVANTPENRQFLKQQENLSSQLREKPDHQMKAWAEQQVQANPLVQSDRHFLDDLARKQQTSQADKPEQ
ncbi:type-F conjugative transfer system pilin assembly protein TrbC, partial [Salmonella enterica subsp. enterica]|nr:type-F conjugative transfer system pilin assembly protein TrbC [Salmonella enterica subsp. enterica]